MRTLSTDLSTAIASNQQEPIELLDIFLGDQDTDDAETHHYAVYNKPVVFFTLAGVGQTYTPLQIARGNITTHMDLSTDLVTLQIDNVKKDFQAIFFQNADKLRDKRVVIRHVDASQLDNVNDGVVLFDATINIAKLNERVLQLEITGGLQNLQYKTGRNLDRLCPLDFADAKCAAGTTQATLWQTAADTAASGSTATAVKATTAAQADDYWTTGSIKFTSGVNNGITRKIIKWVQSTKVITPDFAFPSTPGVGDSFELKRGCDKTVDACAGFTEVHATKGNTDNFAGFNTVVQSVNP